MNRSLSRLTIRGGPAALAVLLVAGSGILAAAGAQPIPRPGVTVPSPEDRIKGLGRYVRLLRAGSGGLLEGRGATWQVWWELNKEHYLGLPRRDQMPGRGDSGGGSPFLGRRHPRDPTARPFGGDLRVRLVRPDLEVLLRDDKDAVRAAAALALGLLGDARATDALIAAVGDGNTDVQDTAVLSLGMVPETRAVRALEELVKGTPEAARLVGQSQVTDRLRATAALALGLAGRPDSLPVLVAATERRQPRDVRAAAVLGIGLLDLEEGELHLARVLERKKSGTQVRAAAAIALGHGGRETSRLSLLSALRSKNTEVRRAAALGLGNLVFRAPATARLSTARERRSEAKDASPESLARMDAFIAELEAAADKEHKEAARFDAARRRALRVAATDDAEYAVRQFAAIALGQTGSSADRGVLVGLLDDRLLEIRPFAALALGILGGRGGDDDGQAATILLREFKAEKRLDHRVAFAVALGLRGWRDAGATIDAEMGRTTDPLARSYYAVALAMLGYTDALPAILRTMLDVREKDELQQSAMAYGLLASAKSADVLAERLARSGDRFERKQAAVGLALFGRSDDLRALSRFVRDTTQPASDRAFVIEGLGMAGDIRDPGPLARLAGAYSFYLGFEAIERAIRRKW